MPYPEIVVYPAMSAYFENIIAPEDSQMEMDLCSQLESMNLEKQWGKEKESETHDQHNTHAIVDVQDLTMSDSEDSTYHTDASDSSSNNDEERSGCGLLQHIHSSIDQYPTTGGDWLEVIFVHRALFAAHPSSHTSCARSFSDIAYGLEKRAWRADREADTECVSAFRYEAWMLAQR